MNDFVEDRSVFLRSVPPPEKTIRYGELADHVADVRFDGKSASERPLVLFIHGGFWRPTFDRTHANPTCAAVAESGWTIASIEYRREPGKPYSTFNDVEQAVRKLPALIENHTGKVV